MNEKEFRKEAEKDTGKKLGDNQLYHAVSSVKKVKIYVENVLIINLNLMIRTALII